MKRPRCLSDFALISRNTPDFSAKIAVKRRNIGLADVAPSLSPA
jgi:hypothetical protein